MSDPVPVKRSSQALLFADRDIQVKRSELAAAVNAQKTKFYDLLIPSGIEDVQSFGNTKVYWLLESMSRYIYYLQRQNIILKNSRAGKMGNDSGKSQSEAERLHDEKMRALKLRQETVKTAKLETSAVDVAFFTDAIDEHVGSVRSALQQAERDVRLEFDDEIADKVAKRISQAINTVCNLELPESLYSQYSDDDYDEAMESEE